MAAYVCTLSGTTAIGGHTRSVDFNGTWDAGGGPRFNIVDEDTTMDAPLDENGRPQSEPMEMKYAKDRVLISGQFTDGWGYLDWHTLPVTKAENLVALQKMCTLPLTLTWPCSTSTFEVKFDRLDISEQAGGGNTLRYDISLLITG